MRFLAVVAFVAASCATIPRPGEGDLTTPDGVRLHYRVAGARGPVVVLLHGGPGSNYNAVWPDLTPLGERFTVVMYDQRGGGRSQLIKDAAQLTAADHVRDLEAVRHHFGLERLTIIGESWGSGLALLYATAHPDRVERVVFLGPMPPTKATMTRRFDQVNETTNFYQRLAEMRKEMVSTPDPIAVCRAMFAAYLKPYFFDESAMARRKGSSCDAPPEGVRNYQTVNDATFASLGDWNFLPLLQQLKVPALVIEGAASRPTLESVHAWAGAIPGKPLVLVPEAGHYPQVEQPKKFFPIVERFLLPSAR
jgi:proline iminopeptidase